jgi:hypothetical protein
MHVLSVCKQTPEARALFQLIRFLLTFHSSRFAIGRRSQLADILKKHKTDPQQGIEYILVFDEECPTMQQLTQLFDDAPKPTDDPLLLQTLLLTSQYRPPSIQWTHITHSLDTHSNEPVNDARLHVLSWDQMQRDPYEELFRLAQAIGTVPYSRDEAASVVQSLPRMTRSPFLPVEEDPATFYKQCDDCMRLIQAIPSIEK